MPTLRTSRRLRALIVALAFGLLWAPCGAGAQPGKVYRIGFLSGTVRPSDADLERSPLRKALADLGYVVGQNTVFEYRYAGGKIERLPELAAELVRAKVDVIVTAGGPSAEAAKQATAGIPVVITFAGDPVRLGLVTSLARPGGNVTGVSDLAVELSAKRLELLKEAAPRASRVAVLWNSADRAMTFRYQDIEAASRTLRVTVQPLGVREPNDFEAAFAAMNRERPDALFLVTDTLTTLNRKRVIDYAAAHRIPAMYESIPSVTEGGLMSYGPSFADLFPRAAYFVDKILKGTKPGELPVEQPTRYYLVLNLRTAKALGLTFPPSLLLRADQVIE